MGLIGSRAKEPKFHWSLLLAIAAWVVIVWGFGRFLATPHVETPPTVEINARIVELPESNPAPAVAAQQPPPARRTQVIPKRPHVQKAVADKPHPTPEKTSTAVTPPVETSPLPDSATPPHPHPQGTEEMGARAIDQPMPKIPEELREEAINAVAVARFHINADGAATVELSKPTPNPRINQIILNALKAWRFFPALRHGMPVPSVQDIKVAVDVN